MYRTTLTIALLAGLPMVATVGCSTAPTTISDQQSLDIDAQGSLRQAMVTDPTLRGALDRSAGYAVFPNAGSGGLIIGAAYGKGVLYQKGQIVGYCDLTQGTIGATIGGKKYAEIVAFETPAELAKFKTGQYAVSADATAVAIRAGAAANAQFKNNIMVFVYDQQGLMADASLGSQSFRYTPAETARQAASPMEGRDTSHGEMSNPGDPNMSR